MNDLTMLYHLDSQQFLGTPALSVVSSPEHSGRRLRATPTATKNAQQAAIVVPQDDGVAGDGKVHANSGFKLRTLENITNSAIFLIPDDSGTSVHFGETAPASYWSVHDLTGAQTPVLYGIEYAIRNELNGLYLHLDTEGNVTLRREASLWRFIPTKTVYVCDPTVDECLSSEQRDNAALGLVCTQKTGCKDRFGRDVLFDLRACSELCGRTSGDLHEGTGGTVLQAVSPAQSTAPADKKKLDVWLIVVIALVVVAFAVAIIVAAVAAGRRRAHTHPEPMA